MKIETKYNIGDVVYIFRNNRIASRKIGYISVQMRIPNRAEVCYTFCKFYSDELDSGDEASRIEPYVFSSKEEIAAAVLAGKL